jgi:hypothetical protein
MLQMRFSEIDRKKRIASQKLLLHTRQNQGGSMKSQIIRMLTPLSMFVLLLTGISPAQYVTRVAQADIPFDFTVGEKTFPAGEYSIVRIERGRLELRDVHRQPLASLITNSVQSLEKSSSTKLRFSTADGGHALIQVWFEGETIGDELLAPKQRTVLARRRLSRSGELGSGGNK